MELSRENFRIMIYYDFKKGLSAYECEESLKSAFGDLAPSLATVYRWYKEFERGCTSVAHRKGAGPPFTAVNPENIAAVKKMVEEDNRITYAMIESKLKIGSSQVRSILHEHLHLKKVVSRFVPHHLTDFQKAERVRICQQTLDILNAGGHQIISKIVTGDETYIPFFDIPTRQESRIWIHEDEETPTMMKKQRAMKKVMYAVFFRSTGLVAAIKLEEQKTVADKWYVEHCLPTVFSKVPRKGILLHHDNASSHTAAITRQYLAENKIKVIEHPPYSPDLPMCDFWLFFELKKHLRGKRFQSEEEIDIAVTSYFDSIPKDSWLNTFKLWKERMVKSIIVNGNYFEHI
ncbi:transposase [Klebsiella pneumoniae]|uniref:transposase n=1 Tax=Klebsiella pneumoniae TaxID=573 RepID=UPI002E803537|nr:transposase [Klebsiella pneumoniae]MEE2373769.1 transposase [Klebsiella pneumoniae]